MKIRFQGFDETGAPLVSLLMTEEFLADLNDLLTTQWDSRADAFNEAFKDYHKGQVEHR